MDAEDLRELVKAENHDVRLVSVRDDDWVGSLQEPADLIAVAGGDGTVARVAKAMVGRGIPLAPLPAGTANNISRTLGLVGRHWEELVRGWADARRATLDIGVAKGPWGSRYFVEGIGAGLFAFLLSDDDPDRKVAQANRPEERVAMALELLKKRAASCTSIDLRASVDGKDVSGRYILAEAVNILYVGP